MIRWLRARKVRKLKVELAGLKVREAHIAQMMQQCTLWPTKLIYDLERCRVRSAEITKELELMEKEDFNKAIKAFEEAKDTK